jgi:hypothetical protein
MPEPIQRTLTALGVTPWQLVIMFLTIGFYYGEAQPRLASIPELTTAVAEVGKNLAELRSDVKVHEVLIRGIQEIKQDQAVMRREISTIEGKLTHVKF